MRDMTPTARRRRVLAERRRIKERHGDVKEHVPNRRDSIPDVGRCSLCRKRIGAAYVIFEDGTTGIEVFDPCGNSYFLEGSKQFEAYEEKMRRAQR